MKFSSPLPALAILTAFTVGLSACASQGGADPKGTAGQPDQKKPALMRMNLPGIPKDKPMPERFTCEGGDHSPPIYIADIPNTARSMAITMEDPDAPSGTFIHWVMWNIPSYNRIIEADITPEGALKGNNGTNKPGYKGPCPPSGEHHYIFKLYALDSKLDLKPGATYDALMKAMEGHIVGQAEYIGLYEKGKGKTALPFPVGNPTPKPQ